MTRRPLQRLLATGVPLSAHSATLSADEADTWSVLVSSLSADDGPHETDSSVLDSTVLDLVDLFTVVDDPGDRRGVGHPRAAVWALCAGAVVAGMKSFTAIAGWVADTPPPLLRQLYARCGKPALAPSKGTIWQ